MQAIPVSDQRLEPEIDALRARHPETQDLYREVCVLLFFRYGITPTANKLYQLVKKGSMSAPAEALNRFWENLREKSRVRIEHPDLPQSLQDSAGEMVGALWQQAQAASEKGYLQLRNDATAAVVLAQANEKTLRELAEVTQNRLNAADSKGQALTDEVAEIKSELARTQGQASALQNQISAAAEQRRELQESHKSQQQSWLAELEQQRRSNLLAQENSASDMRRVLLDIDRERLVSVKLQKELLQTRSEAGAQQELARQKSEQAQQQFQAAVQKNMQLEAALVQLRAESARLAEQISKAEKTEKASSPSLKPVPLNPARIRQLNAARFR